MTVHECQSAAELVQRLASWLGLQLHAALQARGQASLAVSGGKSPVPLFHALRQQPLDWARVRITLVDERCVPTDHADSNTALVREHLLQGAAAAARFVPWFDTLPEPLDDAALSALAQHASERIATEIGVLDMVVLGMGEDAHTASLFPGAPGLDEALRSTGPVAWTRPGTAPHARLTLSLPALRQARMRVLPLQGPTKRLVFQRACLAEDPQLPISLLLHSPDAPTEVWLA